MIQGVIFDADGTLLDSTAMWMSAGERYLNTIGVQAEPTLGARLFAMSIQDSIQHLKTHYQLAQTTEEILEGIHKTIWDFYRHEVTLKPGARELLLFLKQQGIPMALATATDRPLIEDALRHTNIFSYFQAIFTCSEVGCGKDKPDIYLQACTALGGDRPNTWVLEDALHGVKSAKAAGFPVAAVYDTMSAAQEESLRVCADLYLQSLSEFVPAVFP